MCPRKDLHIGCWQMTQSDRLAFLVKTDMEGELFLGGGGGLA